MDFNNKIYKTKDLYVGVLARLSNSGKTLKFIKSEELIIFQRVERKREVIVTDIFTEEPIYIFNKNMLEKESNNYKVGDNIIYKYFSLENYLPTSKRELSIEELTAIYNKLPFNRTNGKVIINSTSNNYPNRQPRYKFAKKERKLSKYSK